MGRLFWKFFLVFWLALLTMGGGMGAAFWLQRNAPGDSRAVSESSLQVDARCASTDCRPLHPVPPPWLPITVGFFVSLVFSGVTAWYFAKPIRQLRSAFAAVAGGDLDTRANPAMGKRHDELADLGKSFDHRVSQHGAIKANNRAEGGLKVDIILPVS